MRKSYCSTVRRRFPTGNAYSCTDRKDYSHLCMWMTSNWLERNKTLIRCRKYYANKSIWENQHHSLIMSTWDVLKDIAKHANILLTITEPCSNPGFPQEQRKNYQTRTNPHVSTWSYDMEGHAKKWMERYCEWANKTTEQLYKVSTPCIDDHQFKEEEMKSMGKLPDVCSQIVLKCLYLARIGRLDILWSVNKLARATTTWTRACDKRLAHLISYIHCTREYKQYWHVGNTAQQCRLGVFQGSDFAGDFEDSKSTLGGTLCVSGSHTFVHSSTEAEILDAGLRMDGIPALDLWDLIIEVLHSDSNRKQKSSPNGETRLQVKHQ